MKTNQKILIIENDVKIANWLRRALEHPLGGGHNVELMLTSQTAESKLQHTSFDLIVISLDSTDSADTVKKTQTLTPTTPILCVMDRDAVQRQALESDDEILTVFYLTKPFEIQEFVSLVQGALNA
jgi:DNA-binding response OmpR family regulator